MHRHRRRPCVRVTDRQTNRLKLCRKDAPLNRGSRRRVPVFVVRRNDTLDRRPDGHSRHQRAEDGRDQPSQVEMMRAFSRDAGARGWKLLHAPEHEQGTHYFQSPYDDAVCFSCSATGEWDDMLRANSKKLRSLQREAEAVAYAAERKDLRCQLEATQALTVQMAAEHAETQIQRARMDPSVL